MFDLKANALEAGFMEKTQTTREVFFLRSKYLFGALCEVAKSIPMHSPNITMQLHGPNGVCKKMKKETIIDTDIAPISTIFPTLCQLFFFVNKNIVTWLLKIHNRFNTILENPSYKV